MKKLLSILGSLGMVATAGMAVVACSKNENKASESYKDFESWVKDSKDNNRTDIVFVGGRKDIDSLSFLAAKKTIVEGLDKVDPQNVDSLIDQKDINKVDEGLYAKLNQDTDKTSVSAIINAAHPTNNLAAGTILNKFWNNDKKPYDGNSLGMHTVLVDDISSFWNNGLGKEIRRGFLTDQVKLWNDFYHDEWNQKHEEQIPSDKKNKKNTPRQNEVQLRANIISKFLDNGQKGPFFIVLNNGNLAGITMGFNNYKQFNNNNKELTVLDKDSATKDMASLLSSIRDNVWNKVDSWVQKCMFPTPNMKSEDTEDSSFLHNNSDITSWHSTTGDTYNKDNASKIKDDTTFALDLKKYID